MLQKKIATKNVANIRGKIGISYRFFFSKFAVAQFFNICNIFCCNFFFFATFYVARFFFCNIFCCKIYLQHLFATSFVAIFYLQHFLQVTYMYKQERWVTSRTWRLGHIVGRQINTYTHTIEHSYNTCIGLSMLSHNKMTQSTLWRSRIGMFTAELLVTTQGIVKGWERGVRGRWIVYNRGW